MENVHKLMIDRPQYIEQLKKWQGQNEIIKIITGVRRCGKSKLFYLYQQELMTGQQVDND